MPNSKRSSSFSSKPAGRIARSPSQLPPNLNVLVVEDDPLVRDSLEVLLMSIGVEAVVTLEDGAKALQYLQDSGDRVDLLVTDLDMPVLDGCALIQRLRSGLAGVARPDMPVVVQTCNPDGEQARSLKSTGTVPVVSKTGRPEVLVDTIARVLAETRSQVMPTADR